MATSSKKIITTIAGIFGFIFGGICGIIGYLLFIGPIMIFLYRIKIFPEDSSIIMPYFFLPIIPIVAIFFSWLVVKLASKIAPKQISYENSIDTQQTDSTGFENKNKKTKVVISSISGLIFGGAIGFFIAILILMVFFKLTKNVDWGLGGVLPILVVVILSMSTFALIFAIVFGKMSTKQEYKFGKQKINPTNIFILLAIGIVVLYYVIKFYGRYY